MLCAQMGQAAAKQSGGQTLEQRQSGQGGKFFRQIGNVLRHADSRV